MGVLVAPVGLGDMGEVTSQSIADLVEPAGLVSEF
jgi:hypothetical protein